MPYLDYLTADSEPGRGMVVMDLTGIKYPDNSFDVIYCSHVLEHIQDDRKAMSELHRVLRPGGWALLQVPIILEKTFEDPSVQTPEERKRVFGQSDHVRAYGKDYRDRLEQAGFVVTIDSFAGRITEERALFLGLDTTEDIFCCRKSGEGHPGQA